MASIAAVTLLYIAAVSVRNAIDASDFALQHPPIEKPVLTMSSCFAILRVIS